MQCAGLRARANEGVERCKREAPPTAGTSGERAGHARRAVWGGEETSGVAARRGEVAAVLLVVAPVEHVDHALGIGIRLVGLAWQGVGGGEGGGAVRWRSC